jgi:hypothetical protein
LIADVGQSFWSKARFSFSCNAFSFETKLLSKKHSDESMAKGKLRSRFLLVANWQLQWILRWVRLI